jgi:putrescine aminotransferase
MTDALTTAEEVVDLIAAHQSSGRALLHRVMGALDYEHSAEGCWVTGGSGQRYLDFGSFAVFLIGHRHPRVVARVIEQLGRMPCSSRSLPSAVNAEAAAAVASIAPPGLSKVMLLNSGTEAVEAAVKLARAATGRTGLAYVEGSFHGKTFAALSLTDAAIFRRRCEPLIPDVQRLSRSDIASAVAAIETQRPAALFVEPIQGEGGVFEMAFDWLRAVRVACAKVGTIFVCDEIQCGLGRSGAPWASAEADIVPDVLLAGKALGGGVLPASAVIARPDVFLPFDRDPLLHTSTFGGNPLACAAVAATVAVLREERIAEQAAQKGRVLRRILEDLVAAWPDLFRVVLGRGLMLGIECRRDDIAGTFLRCAQKEGLLLTPCITRPSVMRVSPPACIGAEEFEFARARLTVAARATRDDLAA